MSSVKLIAKNSNNFFQFSKKYLKNLSLIFNKIDKKSFDNVLKEFNYIRSKKLNLFVAGNGGGAATATTMANDLGFDILKKTKTKNPFKIISLTDNTSVISAIANDTGYDNIFINQLKIHFKKQDRLLIFSASGNSKNLIKAAQWVKKNGGKVIGILGFNGGKLKNICDVSFHIKTENGDYGPVEDIQLMLNHILAHWFQEKIKK
jgi:D-sedoheptulose 7-phosphate isomerase